MSNNNSIPWIEKYRPKKLNEVISQEESISILNNTLKTGELPHLLLYGGPGTGKTSSILALSNQLFGPVRVNERVIELNASDERGINVVRGKIISFAKVAIGTSDPKYLCPPYKIIILDEADAMTKEAQAALRKVMEENSNITRFCFICNYINQIIEPINSRCVKIRFKPIARKSIISKLEWIAEKENMLIQKDALKSIAEISNGDLRKSILMLQNIKYIKVDYLGLKFDHTDIEDDFEKNIFEKTFNKKKLENNLENKVNKEITSLDIYEMCKYISIDELTNYVENIRNTNSVSNVIKITKDIINKGYVFNSIINKMIEYIIDNDNINDIIKAKILFEMSFIEKNINDGADEYIQLLRLLNNVSNI
jgi:replication factor C subunit 2/4